MTTLQGNKWSVPEARLRCVRPVAVLVGGYNAQEVRQSWHQHLKVIKFHHRVYLPMWRSILVLENAQTLKLHLYHHQGMYFVYFFLPRNVEKFVLAKSVYLDTIPPGKFGGAIVMLLWVIARYYHLIV